MDKNIEKTINSLHSGDTREFEICGSGPFNASVASPRSGEYIGLLKEGNIDPITVNVHTICGVEKIGYTVEEALKKIEVLKNA
ncbi:MAG: hypothetical protein PHY72_03995 [Candidatus Pacebacteria bacterium]|nr:hypothetical protein [Candidatus Paceibacterota bacterium]